MENKGNLEWCKGFASGSLAFLIPALVVGVIPMAIWPESNRWYRNGHDAGVIAATRGTHVAELVEQPDGTSEWRVREVEDGK